MMQPAISNTASSYPSKLRPRQAKKLAEDHKAGNSQDSRFVQSGPVYWPLPILLLKATRSPNKFSNEEVHFLSRYDRVSVLPFSCHHSQIPSFPQTVGLSTNRSEHAISI